MARAHGPSGPNCDYIYKLAAAMRDMGVVDDELFQLEARVRQLRAEQQQQQQRQPEGAAGAAGAKAPAGTGAAVVVQAAACGGAAEDSDP